MGKKLEGKTAIITGGTAGIGKAATILFAEEGAEVVFAGRREEEGKEIEKELTEKGFDVTFVKTDITKDEDLDNLVKSTLDKYGKIDILYNNVGITKYDLFVDVTMETANKILDTNFISMFKLTRLVVPIILKHGNGGSIINTSSVAALFGEEKRVMYSASKAAIRQFTKALAAEIGKDNVRVNCLIPGTTLTDMIAGKNIEEAVKDIPLRRAASAHEVAKGALFLASDDSSYMTAADLVIDGGFSCCK